MTTDRFDLKNINSVSELFEYICKLEKDLEARENLINSQIVYIANLHADNDELRQKVVELTAQLKGE